MQSSWRRISGLVLPSSIKVELAIGKSNLSLEVQREVITKSNLSLYSPTTR